MSNIPLTVLLLVLGGAAFILSGIHHRPGLGILAGDVRPARIVKHSLECISLEGGLYAPRYMATLSSDEKKPLL